MTRDDVHLARQSVSVADLATDGTLSVLDAIVLAAAEGRASLLQTANAVRSLLPSTPIVAIWPDGQRREDGKALRAGIDGLVLDTHIESALLPTLKAVRAGLVCLPPRPTATSRADSLSAREKQVLGMLVLGFTNAEIGRQLYLAESTVKSHLSSAYEKLGVRSRKDAAALILDPEDGLGTGALAIATNDSARRSVA